ncbi:hypothetical protein [Streptomyces rubradiris]|uniref:Uncharacterized protein n=1 Tax=Streptomyces rubradiris TaxID=285531 RepID=A0ABQ3RA41_STRRR|nr:hypothetical protein [Streptomyces rubradiris]GHH25739.1 hypothetical protein GCM10018792_65130 [Streptomyces rubradiris]GHI52718.1 hypothetical protein Srubr_25640 [Streptomyces rubradiris]
MAYDAGQALDELFETDTETDTGGDPEELVIAQTEAILDGPALSDSVDEVLRLAQGLPSLEEVREVPDGDLSELTDLEQQQKEQTERIMATAVAAGNAALWVVAQCLDRAAKGRWWRRTHSTLGAYCEEKIGRSPVYARQLRSNAPLALETAQRTGTVPPPSHIKETRKTEQLHGREAALSLYEIVLDISAELGEKPTAASLAAVHVRLPAELPAATEQQRAAIEETVRRTLGAEDASNEAPTFDSESNKDASNEAPRREAAADAGSGADDGDDIEDAEIVPEYMATLQDALKKLKAIDRALTKAVFVAAAAEPADGSDYATVREEILKKATAIRNKALHAPMGRPIAVKDEQSAH